MHALRHTNLYCTVSPYCKFKEIWVNSKQKSRLDIYLIVYASNNSNSLFSHALQVKK